MESSGADIQYGALIWRAIVLRRWMVGLVFLAVAGPLVAYAFLMDARYESTGTVWVEERNAGVFQDVMGRGRLPVLLTILGSRSLAAGVVDALPRRAYEELLRKRTYTDWVTEVANRVRRLLGRPVVAVSPREQVITELVKGRTTFHPKGSTGIVYVTALASDPTIAADIATAYIETLQSKTRFFTREESRAVREFLEGQAKQVGASLQEAREALVQHERQRGAVKVDDRVAQSLSNLGQVETQLTAASLSEDIARTRLAAVKSQLEGQPAGKKVTGSFTVPPSLKDLAERWRKAEARLATLTQRYTDAFPQVRAAREDAQQLWIRLDAGLRQALRISASPNLPPSERAPLVEQAVGLAQDVAKYQAEREAYAAHARSLQGALGSLSQEQYEMAQRRQAVEATQNLYNLLTQKSEEAGIRAQDDLRDIRVLDPPAVPVFPSGRQALKVLLVALALGVTAALGLPVGLETLDSTIKTEEEAEAVLGWPVLGTILAMEPRSPLASNGVGARALPPAPPSGRGGRA